MKNYQLSASKFITWATHRKILPRVRGLVEHFSHHQAVVKYQRLASVPLPASASNCAVAWSQRENMPLDLVTAKLLMSECEIKAIWQDLVLIGRVDQAYVDKQNRVILVDSKAHPSVTFSDQLQLSFYAYILRKNGHHIGDYGYIRSYACQDIEYLEVDIIPAVAFIEILRLID